MERDVWTDPRRGDVVEVGASEFRFTRWARHRDRAEGIAEVVISETRGQTVGPRSREVEWAALREQGGRVVRRG